MEEEHQGSRTPASVGFTSPTRSATPGERPSPAYRGVGAARDPDEPTRVAVLANLPTARVVEAGVLGTPPPSARPGDSDPGLVGVPASEPSTPAPAPATSGRALSADEIARRDAIRALAKAAAKHGIPLRQADGSVTPSTPKPERLRPIPTSAGNPATYLSTAQRFPPRSSPQYRRELARASPPATAAAGGSSAGLPDASIALAAGDPSRAENRKGDKKVSKDSLALAASRERVRELEAQVAAMRESFVRERAALRDVAERVQRKAEDDISETTISFLAQKHKLEEERDAAQAAFAEVEQTCEARWADERAQNAVEVVKARDDAAAELAKAAEVWRRERELLRESTEREKAQTAREREQHEASAARSLAEWERERTSLVAQLEETAAQWKGEHKKLVAANAFQKAADAIVWEKKVAKARDEAETRVAQARDEGEAKLRRANEEAERRVAEVVRERDDLLARFEREREATAREREQERVVHQAQMEDANRKLEAAREESKKHLAARDEARSAADEAERTRGEAVRFADEWRSEAKAAREYAETARADAERAVLAGREEVNAELASLREAHEARVQAAALELEEERRRDAETNRAAYEAAEAGATAALEEASAAVDAARAETRDAARTFSLALVLRNWWMWARCKGEGAREAAVAARRGPAIRRAKRAALLAWRDASPRPSDVRRANAARARGVAQRRFLAWRRALAERDRRANAATVRGSFACGSRRKETLRWALRVWASFADDEARRRVAGNRVAAKTARRRRARAFAAWAAYVRLLAGFEAATVAFAARRREAKLRAILRTWFVKLCSARHEQNLVDAAKRRFWAFKSARIMRQWYAVARSMYVDRRVTLSYRRRRYLAALRGAFDRWRRAAAYETRSASRLAKANRHRAARLVRVFASAWSVAAHRAGAERRRAVRCDLIAEGRVARVVRPRLARRALRAWSVETSRERRARVVASRCRLRRDRRVLARTFHAWCTSGEAEHIIAKSARDAHARRTVGRLRQRAFFAWRRRANAANAALALAAKVRDGVVGARYVLRPWFARAMALRAARAEAHERAKRRDARLANAAFAAIRHRVARARRIVAAAESARTRRVYVAKSSAYAAWASLAAAQRTALARHAALRRHQLARRGLHAWYRLVAEKKLGALLAKRRATAMRGYKRVGAWRLVERCVLAWCKVADAANKARFAVKTMRVARVARRVVRAWKDRVAARRRFERAFIRVVAAPFERSRACRYFTAWRVHRDAVERRLVGTIRKAKRAVKRAAKKRAVDAWAKATRDAALNLANERRASGHAARVVGRRAFAAFRHWRERADATRATRERERRAEARADATSRRRLKAAFAAAFAAWRSRSARTRELERLAAVLRERRGKRRVRTAHAAWRRRVADGPRDRRDEEDRARRAVAADARRAVRERVRAVRAWRLFASTAARNRRLVSAMRARRDAALKSRVHGGWRAAVALASEVREALGADARARLEASEASASASARAIRTSAAAAAAEALRKRAVRRLARRTLLAWVARLAAARRFEAALRDAADAARRGAEDVATCALAFGAWRERRARVRAFVADARTRREYEALATRAAALDAWRSLHGSLRDARREANEAASRRASRTLRALLSSWRRASAKSRTRADRVARTWTRAADASRIRASLASRLGSRVAFKRRLHARFRVWRAFAEATRSEARTLQNARTVLRASRLRRVLGALGRLARRSALVAAFADESLAVARAKRRASAFSAWATLAGARPRWNLRGAGASAAVARRRLDAFGGVLSASARRVSRRAALSAWARVASTEAAERAEAREERRRRAAEAEAAAARETKVAVAALAAPDEATTLRRERDAARKAADEATAREVEARTALAAARDAAREREGAAAGEIAAPPEPRPASAPPEPSEEGSVAPHMPLAPPPSPLPPPDAPRVGSGEENEEESGSPSLATRRSGRPGPARSALERLALDESEDGEAASEALLSSEEQHASQLRARLASAEARASAAEAEAAAAKAAAAEAVAKRVEAATAAAASSPRRTRGVSSVPPAAKAASSSSPPPPERERSRLERIKAASEIALRLEVSERSLRAARAESARLRDALEAARRDAGDADSRVAASNAAAEDARASAARTLASLESAESRGRDLETRLVAAEARANVAASDLDRVRAELREREGESREREAAKRAVEESLAAAENAARRAEARCADLAEQVDAWVSRGYERVRGASAPRRTPRPPPGHPSGPTPGRAPPKQRSPLSTAESPPPNVFVRPTPATPRTPPDEHEHDSVALSLVGTPAWYAAAFSFGGAGPGVPSSPGTGTVPWASGADAARWASEAAASLAAPPASLLADLRASVEAARRDAAASESRAAEAEAQAEALVTSGERAEAELRDAEGRVAEAERRAEAAKKAAARERTAKEAAEHAAASLDATLDAAKTAKAKAMVDLADARANALRREARKTADAEAKRAAFEEKAKASKAEARREARKAAEHAAAVKRVEAKAEAVIADARETVAKLRDAVADAEKKRSDAERDRARSDAERDAALAAKENAEARETEAKSAASVAEAARRESETRAAAFRAAEKAAAEKASGAEGRLRKSEAAAAEFAARVAELERAGGDVVAVVDARREEAERREAAARADAEAARAEAAATAASLETAERRAETLAAELDASRLDASEARADATARVAMLEGDLASERAESERLRATLEAAEAAAAEAAKEDAATSMTPGGVFSRSSPRTPRGFHEGPRSPGVLSGGGEAFAGSPGSGASFRASSPATAAARAATREALLATRRRESELAAQLAAAQTALASRSGSGPAAAAALLASACAAAKEAAESARVAAAEAEAAEARRHADALVREATAREEALAAARAEADAAAGEEADRLMAVVEQGGGGDGFAFGSGDLGGSAVNVSFFSSGTGTGNPFEPGRAAGTTAASSAMRRVVAVTSERVRAARAEAAEARRDAEAAARELARARRGLAAGRARVARLDEEEAEERRTLAETLDEYAAAADARADAATPPRTPERGGGVGGDAPATGDPSLLSVPPSPAKARLLARVAELEAREKAGAAALARAADALAEAKAREAASAAEAKEAKEAASKALASGASSDAPGEPPPRAPRSDAGSLEETLEADGDGELAARLRDAEAALAETRGALRAALEDAARAKAGGSFSRREGGADADADGGGTPNARSKKSSRSRGLFRDEDSDEDSDEDAREAKDVRAAATLQIRVDAMREEIATLTRERDAARKLLAASTKRERSLEEALREVKRSAMADALAASGAKASAAPVSSPREFRNPLGANRRSDVGALRGAAAALEDALGSLAARHHGRGRASFRRR